MHPRSPGGVATTLPQRCGGRGRPRLRPRWPFTTCPMTPRSRASACATKRRLGICSFLGYAEWQHQVDGVGAPVQPEADRLRRLIERAHHRDVPGRAAPPPPAVVAGRRRRWLRGGVDLAPAAEVVSQHSWIKGTHPGQVGEQAAGGDLVWRRESRLRIDRILPALLGFRWARAGYVLRATLIRYSASMWRRPSVAWLWRSASASSSARQSAQRPSAVSRSRALTVGP
jgi:hypothetical protein